MIDRSCVSLLFWQKNSKSLPRTGFFTAMLAAEVNAMRQQLAKTTSGKSIQVFIGSRKEADFFYQYYYSTFAVGELIEVLAVAEAFIMDNLPYKEVGISLLDAVKYLNYFCRERVPKLDPEGTVSQSLGLQTVFDLVALGRRRREKKIIWQNS